jgi:hypothetical protein
MAIAFVRVQAPLHRYTFSAGRCSAGYDENASNGACTDDKELSLAPPHRYTDENKENATRLCL